MTWCKLLSRESKTWIHDYNRPHLYLYFIQPIPSHLQNSRPPRAPAPCRTLDHHQPPLELQTTTSPLQNSRPLQALSRTLDNHKPHFYFSRHLASLTRHTHQLIVQATVTIVAAAAVTEAGEIGRVVAAPPGACSVLTRQELGLVWGAISQQGGDGGCNMREEGRVQHRLFVDAEFQKSSGQVDIPNGDTRLLHHLSCICLLRWRQNVPPFPQKIFFACPCQLL